MKQIRVGIFVIAISTTLSAQAGRMHEVKTDHGAYARIAILRPNDGAMADFEAGYVRHLDWHRQAGDRWAWYGWSIWAGERQRWFVYATFGHSAADFDHPVPPVEDERDTSFNVTPYVTYRGSALYEFLPELSRGTGEPQPTARLEFATVEVWPGKAKAFEAALGAGQSGLQGETLWYRMVAGGAAPQYVRLRARASFAELLDGKSDAVLPDSVSSLITKTTVEILTLRPAMCYGVTGARP